MGRKKLVSDEHLLKAAKKLFVTQGLKASTRMIAREAGISEAVLFQRYGTKADLFFAAMSPPAFDLETAAPETDRETPEREMRSLFLALLEYFRAASPVFVQLLASHNFQFEKFAQAHPNNSLATLRWAVMQRLTKLKNANDIGADPAFAALALFTVAQGLAVFERLGAHGGKFEPFMIEGTINAIWTGLRPKS